MQLMKNAPAIGHYVRHLELSFEEDDDLSDFPRTLQCLTRLESLNISQDEEPLDWRSLTWPNRNALLRLMNLPTFSSLTHCSVDNFLLVDLLHATNLRRLEITNTTLYEDSADASPMPISFPDKLVRLRELVIHPYPRELGICIEMIALARRSDGLPVIDLTELSTLSVKCYCQGEMDTLHTFLKHIRELVKFNLRVFSPLTFTGYADMITPHKRALKNASLTFALNRSCTLDNICSELTKISGENVLEFLSIHVHIWEYKDITTEDGWGMLDKVLTSSGWPALEIFLLEISLFYFCLSFDDQRELKQFTKSLFPRLLASTRLDFRLQFK